MTRGSATVLVTQTAFRGPVAPPYPAACLVARVVEGRAVREHDRDGRLVAVPFAVMAKGNGVKSEE